MCSINPSAIPLKKENAIEIKDLNKVFIKKYKTKGIKGLFKPDTKEFSYEFIGWDKDIDAFYKHENVYAVYKAIPKKYTYL